jgi:hypothetical protein
MKMADLAEETRLLEDLEKRDIKAFIQLYKINKDDLIIFAFSHLQDRTLVAEAIDELFERLWVSGQFAGIKPPIYQYLLAQLRDICQRKASR